MHNIFRMLLVTGITSGVSMTAGPAGLSGLKHLKRSEDFLVTVNGRELFVYQTFKNSNHGTYDVQTMSFAGFDLDKAVRVEVSVKRSATRFEIRPYSAGIEARREGNVISFALNKTQHVLLTFNDAYDGALLLSANPPESPPAPTTVQHYFAPGVHDLKGHYPLKSDDQVYLAEGAVVMGGFALKSARNVTIRGRGMIYGGEHPHQENYRVIKGDDTADVLIEGITICNAPGWIISFWGGSRNLTVRNVKMVGNFRYNTDGVQTGTDGLLVEDCFMQCNDDNFSLNGVCRNAVIRGNVLWNLYNGGVFMLGWATGNQFDLQNLAIRDNVILRAGGCCDYDRKGPFSMKLFGTQRSARDIRFQNVVIEDLAAYGRWVDFQAAKATRSVVSNLTFENIELMKAWQVEGELNGMPDRPIEKVVFKDIKICGQLMADPAQGGLNLINTRDVTVQGVACSNAMVSRAVAAVAPETTNANRAPRPVPPEAFPPASSNLLANASFDGGLESWTPSLPGKARLEIVPSMEANGGKVIRVYDRASGQAGLQQDITELLRNNGTGNYLYAARVRAIAGTVPLKVSVRIEDRDGPQEHPAPDVQATSDGWSVTRRTQPLKWNDLKSAVLKVESNAGSTGEFLVDQCWLTR